MKKYLILFFVHFENSFANKRDAAALLEKPTELLESIMESLVAFGLPFFSVAIAVTAYLVYHQRIGKQYLWSSMFGAFVLLIGEGVIKFLFGFFSH